MCCSKSASILTAAPVDCPKENMLSLHQARAKRWSATEAASGESWSKTASIDSSTGTRCSKAAPLLPVVSPFLLSGISMMWPKKLKLQPRAIMYSYCCGNEPARPCRLNQLAKRDVVEKAFQIRAANSQSAEVFKRNLHHEGCAVGNIMRASTWCAFWSIDLLPSRGRRLKVAMQVTVDCCMAKPQRLWHSHDSSCFFCVDMPQFLCLNKASHDYLSHDPLTSHCLSNEIDYCGFGLSISHH